MYLQINFKYNVINKYYVYVFIGNSILSFLN